MSTRDQIIVKMRRRLGSLTPEARAQFEKEAGETPELALERIRQTNIQELGVWAKLRPRLGPILDWTNEGRRGLASCPFRSTVMR